MQLLEQLAQNLSKAAWCCGWHEAAGLRCQQQKTDGFSCSAERNGEGSHAPSCEVRHGHCQEPPGESAQSGAGNVRAGGCACMLRAGLLGQVGNGKGRNSAKRSPFEQAQKKESFKGRGGRNKQAQKCRQHHGQTHSGR